MAIRYLSGINVDSNTLVVDDVNNRVGIGTASPADTLTVNGTFRSPALWTTSSNITQWGAGSTAYGTLTWNTGYARIHATSGNRLDLGASGGLHMSISTAGNVGIGTTSPSVKLTVNGDNDQSGIGILNINTPGTSLKLGGNSTYSWIQSHSSRPLYINELGNNVILNSTGGNVGIGTTAPGYKLDVAGTISNNSEQNFIYSTYDDVGALFQRVGTYGAVIRIGRKGVSNSTTIDYPADGTFAVSTSGSERMRITSSGNVGIGTTSPGAKIHVVGSESRFGGVASGYISVYNATSRSGYIQANGGTDLRIASDSDPMTMYVNGSERFRISATGNVGIGTSIPTNKLQIGSVGSTGFSGNDIVIGNGTQVMSFYQSATISIWYTNTSFSLMPSGAGSVGNLGVGTDSPTQRVHVSGNVRVTGAYYDSNNEAGTSGQVLTSTGTGTDWKSLSEITGVDGTGTANYVAKWSDTDTITNSQIQDNGTTVGIGQAPGAAKLSVAGNSISAGGKVTYKKGYTSGVDTTGVAVAGITSSFNGDSTMFEFTCSGGAGHYQKVIYSCWNVSGVWNTRKSVDEGSNAFDVEASANAATITFTLKSRSGLQQYTPKVVVEVNGSYDTSYL